MSKSINATHKNTLIEKFKGKFDEVEGGCTVIHTKSIQLLNKIENLSIYTYLCSKPQNWIINAEEISKHFSMGIKKVYKALKDLILIALIEKIEIREKGQFAKHLYRLYLSPLGQNDQVVELSTDHSAKNHLVDEPLGHFGLTYKEEILIPYKEENIKKDFTNIKLQKPEPKTSKHPIPTAQDYKDYLQCKPGSEWVGEYRKDMGMQ